MRKDFTLVHLQDGYILLDYWNVHIVGNHSTVSLGVHITTQFQLLLQLLIYGLIAKGIRFGALRDSEVHLQLIGALSSEYTPEWARHISFHLTRSSTFRKYSLAELSQIQTCLAQASLVQALSAT